MKFELKLNKDKDKNSTCMYDVIILQPLEKSISSCTWA